MALQCPKLIASLSALDCKTHLFCACVIALLLIISLWHAQEHQEGLLYPLPIEQQMKTYWKTTCFALA